MQIGVNVASFYWKGDFLQLKSLLARCGAECVEFPVQLFHKKGGGAGALTGLRVASMSGLLHRTDVIPDSLLIDPETWGRQSEMLDDKCRTARDLRCSSFALAIDALSPSELAEPRAIYIERARHCADIAASFLIGINLEFIAPAVARANGEPDNPIFCHSLEEAMEIAKAVQRKNVGLLLDFVHWYADGCPPLTPELVAAVGLVHVADHAAPDSLSDEGRLLPFEGVLPLRQFLGALKNAGYGGPVLVETFAKFGSDHNQRLADGLAAIRSEVRI